MGKERLREVLRVVRRVSPPPDERVQRIPVSLAKLRQRGLGLRGFVLARGRTTVQSVVGKSFDSNAKARSFAMLPFTKDHGHPANHRFSPPAGPARTTRPAPTGRPRSRGPRRHTAGGRSSEPLVRIAIDMSNRGIISAPVCCPACSLWATCSGRRLHQARPARIRRARRACRRPKE